MAKRNLTAEDIRAAENLKRIWKAKHKALKLTQQKAADILDVNQSAISQYLNGRIACGIKATLGFSKMLQVDPLEIRPELDFYFINAHGSQDAGEANVASNTPSLSLLDDVIAARPREILKSYLHNSQNPQIGIDNTLAQTLSDYAYALRVKDEAMAPEFNIGDLIIVDPNEKPEAGSVVLVKLADSNAIIRRYQPLNNQQNSMEFLLAVNNKAVAEDIKVSFSECKLLGVIVEHRRVRPKAKF